jgi:DNA-binding transcriptional ArsR family regulator
VTSRHLQRLRQAGIVTAERRGKMLLCTLSPRDTVGGDWLARAIQGSTPPVPRDEPRRVTVRRERPRRAAATATAAAVPSIATTPVLPRRELDDYLL